MPRYVYLAILNTTLLTRCQVLHAIEQELNTEILPGTELMADVGSHHFVKSSGKSHRVLVPQPTADKHDPLNWSRKWKTSAFIASSFVTFMQGFGPLSLAPMFGDYIVAFNCSLADAVQFTGVAILVLGFSNFIWYVTCNVMIFSWTDSMMLGSRSAPHLVDDQSTLHHSLSVSALPSGEPEHRPMAASWAPACTIVLFINLALY